MRPDIPPKRPTSRRPFSFRADAGLVVLLAFAAPAFAWFCWHEGLATVSDDSVSYLIQARVYAGSAPGAVREWLGNAAHFPPLFPLLLAAGGGADDFLRAHLLVAVCAALALVPMYVFGRAHAGRAAAAGLPVVFLFMPTAWVSSLGILSEPLYLLLSFAALAWHAWRLSGERTTPVAGLVLGVWLALCLLARSAGVALVAAYLAWAFVRVWRRAERPAALAVPLLPVALALGAWLALRPPLVGENYGQVLRNAWGMLVAAPGLFALRSASYLGDAWIGSFTAESHVYAGTRLVLLCGGAMALLGAARAALLNRIDGWYALAYTAMLAFWIFPEETARRLLYPVIPLALFHAGEMLHSMVRRAAGPGARWIVAAAAAAVAAFSLPALALVASKAAERAPVMSISTQSYSGITDYYTIIPVKPAREAAGRQIAVLAGLAQVERFTPPDARVLWMRPDYVALLSHRTGVPSYYRDGMQGVARQLLASGARYIVVSTLYKADIRGEMGDPLVTPAAVASFSHPLFIVRNPAADITEFALLEVDPPALERYAAQFGAGAGKPR